MLISADICSEGSVTLHAFPLPITVYDGSRFSKSLKIQHSTFNTLLPH